MVIKKSYVVAGVAVAAGVAVGVHAIVRAVRRYRNRVLPKDVRKLMIELMELEGEDFAPSKAPGGGLGKSLFIRKIEKCDDRQLMAIFAIVEVGYFLKASGIDPARISKEQLKQITQKFAVEQEGAPKDRASLLGVLDTTDAHDALKAAFMVLGSA